MAAETELERLVVRIVGDQTDLENTATEATHTVESVSASLESLTKRIGLSLDDLQNQFLGLDDGIEETARQIEAFEKSMEEGDRVTQSVQNSTERYGEEMEKLDTLLSEGAISQETYARATKEAGDQFKAAGDELKQFGEKVQGVGTMVSLYLTTPLVGLGAFGVAQFTEMKDGMVSLESAIKSNGGAVQETLADYVDFAGGIQQATTMGDDAVLAILKTAESYQLSGESAKKAAKDAIALGAETGSNAQSMIRMTAAMAAGDTHKAMMFARMIPQLRGIKDEQVFVEKYTHLVAAGFEKAEALAGTLSGQLSQLWNDFGDLGEEIGAVIATGLMPLISAAKDVVHWFQSFSPEVKTAMVILGALVAAIGPVIFAVGTLIVIAGTLTTSMATLGITSVAAGVSMLAAFWPVYLIAGAVALAIGGVVYAYSSASEAAKEFEEDAIAAKEAVEFAGGGEIGGMEEGGFGFEGGEDLAGGAFGATENADKMVEKLKDQIATFGMASREAEIYRLEMDGLSKSELDNVRALDAQLTAMEEQEKQMKELFKAREAMQKEQEREQAQLVSLGKSLTAQYATPMEKAVEKHNELQKALEAGVISNEIYERGLKAVNDELEKASKEHEAKLKLTGIDAVASGSAEALARIAEFQAGAGGSLVQKIKGADMPGMLAKQESEMKPNNPHGNFFGAEPKPINDMAEGIKMLVEQGIAAANKDTMEIEVAGL